MKKLYYFIKYLFLNNCPKCGSKNTEYHDYEPEINSSLCNFLECKDCGSHS